MIVILKREIEKIKMHGTTLTSGISAKEVETLIYDGQTLFETYVSYLKKQLKHIIGVKRKM